MILKTPRSDTNGVGEDEVTVTSALKLRSLRLDTPNLSLHPLLIQSNGLSRLVLSTTRLNAGGKSRICMRYKTTSLAPLICFLLLVTPTSTSQRLSAGIGYMDQSSHLIRFFAQIPLFTVSLSNFSLSPIQ